MRIMGERLCRKRLQHLTQRWLGVAAAANAHHGTGGRNRCKWAGAYSAAMDG